VTEHHFYEDGYMPSPLVMTAAVAARTERVAVGTNLLQLPLHHPVRVAEDALVGDIISGGRLRLGVGAGYYWQEFQGVGAVLEERRLNRTYWCIVDEDPERAYAAAGPHFMHMFNDYIRREGYPHLEVLEDPEAARREGLEGGYLLCTDAAGAIAAFNENIAMGA